MSNLPPEDPRVRPSKPHRKQRSIVRVGDEADGRDCNFTNSQQEIRSRPFSNIPMPPSRKKSKQDREVTPILIHSNFSPVLDSATLAQIASESVQNARAAMDLPREAWERPTAANPLVPRRHERVQAANTPSSIPVVASPFQAQGSDNSGWLVPMDSAFLHEDQLEQISFSNYSAFFRKEQEIQKEDENVGLGTPRKRNPILPQNQPTTPRFNHQYLSPQLQTEHNQFSIESPQDSQMSYPQYLTQNHTQTQKNSSAQALLLQFIQNQASVVNTATNVMSFSFNQPTPFANHSSLMKSSHSRYLKNLRVTLDPFDTRAIKPLSQQRGFAQVNPAVNYFLVLHYLISEQASKNKTNNIHLILDRLQASLRGWTFPTSSEHGQCSIPLQTKVKYLKEYFPYIASIKQWHQNIRNYIYQYQNTVKSFRKRSTQVADSKLLLLKSCGVKAKQALNLVKSSVNAFLLLSDEAKKAAEMMVADSTNNKRFTFTHPDDDFVLVCEKVNKDYQSIRKTTDRMLCLSPNHSTLRPSKESLNVDQILEELVKKLAVESGSLCELQERFRKLKERYRERQTLQDKKRQQWKLVDLFREIKALLKRKTSPRNDF